ncbi:MAG: hypothetical protein OCD01_04275 [Fibrobacterales bacterium]
MKKIIITLVTLSALGFSQEFNQNVSDFVAGFYNKNTEKHRSGQVLSNKKLFEGVETDFVIEDFEETEELYQLDNSDVTHWKERELPEYRLNFNANKRLLKRFKKKKYDDFEIQYDSSDKVCIVTPKVPMVAKWKKFSERKANRFADRILRKKFAFLKGKIEFSNSIKETESIDESGAERVVKYGVRYRRIFRKGILRKNISFVEVWFDASGSLEKIELRWPKFRSKQRYEAVTINEAWLGARDELISIVHGDLGALANIQVTGISLAWMPIKESEDDQTVGLISPCYSFMVQFPEESEFAQKEMLIDVPALRKYLNN